MKTTRHLMTVASHEKQVPKTALSQPTSTSDGKIFSVSQEYLYMDLTVAKLRWYRNALRGPR